MTNRSFSYELLRNAMSDERGKPRVISCALRNAAAYAAVNPWRCEQYTPVRPTRVQRYEQNEERAERCEGAYLEVSD